MHITLPKRVWEGFGEKELALVGRDNRHSLYGAENLLINLRDLDDEQVAGVKAAVERVAARGVPRTETIVKDIEHWGRLVAGTDNAGLTRPRSLRRFADLLIEYLLNTPGHRVYSQRGQGVWLAYTVADITYNPEENTHNGYSPANVVMLGYYYRLGAMQSHAWHFHKDDVDGRIVAQALADMGLLAETPELREAYTEELALWEGVFPNVGRQYLAYGSAEELVRWGGKQTPMMRDGVPAKVVVDGANEEGVNVEGITKRRGLHFWEAQKPKATRGNSDTLTRNVAVEDNGADIAIGQAEVPVHPYVPIYHLRRHERFSIHIQNLEEYVYNQNLGEHLILPPASKQLVDVLVSQGRVTFKDIMEGKGGGACILLGGPPGVGKTLTAEVFAEATERPLLTIQAAQLGTSAAHIEEKIAVYLARGSRFNAVVLLDEADVYISRRGRDIQQNAVVAAFLRILESHTSTLFLTTNMVDNVDDAISSRCVARVDYQMPDAAAQRRIWGVLNGLNEAGLTEEELDAIVAAHGGLSGRDIKQLLKLGAMWAAGNGERITPATIDFVRLFLPTAPNEQ